MDKPCVRIIEFQGGNYYEKEKCDFNNYYNMHFINHSMPKDQQYSFALFYVNES